MKKLFIILSILISSIAYATNPNDTIYDGKVDIDYLEKLVFDKINEYRSGYVINQLEWIDTISDQASVFTKHLYDTKTFVHDDNRKTLGEALLGTVIITDIETYDKVATKCVKQFKDSYLHDAILLMDRGCSIGAVGAYVSNDNTLYLAYRISGKPVAVNDPRFSHVEF